MVEAVAQTALRKPQPRLTRVPDERLTAGDFLCDPAIAAQHWPSLHQEILRDSLSIPRADEPAPRSRGGRTSRSHVHSARSAALLRCAHKPTGNARELAWRVP